MSTTERSRTGRGTVWRWDLVVGLGALLLTVIAVVWGRQYQEDVPEIFLGAAPFVGRDFRDGWDWRFGWGLVGAGIVAAVNVAASVAGWWWRVGVRTVVAASSIGAGLFAVLLALTDGEDGVLYSAAHRTEYLVNVASAPPAAEFVRTFVERLDEYSVHQRGHPPGFVLLLKAIDAVGLAGAWPVAALSILAAIAVPAGVLVAVGTVAGTGWVRRVAPFLVVAPYALWMVTSADAVFAAVGAWGVAALALALTWHGARAVAAGAVAGLLLGGLLFLTYGTVTFMLLPIAMIVSAGWRDRSGVAGVTVAAVVGLGVVTLSFAAAGFWWFAGAAATRLEYWEGTAQFRTGAYFAIGNLAVAAIAVGPATWAGLGRLRGRRVGVLVIGGVLALVAAHLSQYSRGEVERIWLLFYPWLAAAGGALSNASDARRTACWVGAQALVAIVLQAALVSKW